jgi:hypothetical protein
MNNPRESDLWTCRHGNLGPAHHTIDGEVRHCRDCGWPVRMASEIEQDKDPERWDGQS